MNLFWVLSGLLSLVFSLCGFFWYGCIFCGFLLGLHGPLSVWFLSLLLLLSLRNSLSLDDSLLRLLFLSLGVGFFTVMCGLFVRPYFKFPLGLLSMVQILFLVVHPHLFGAIL